MKLEDVTAEIRPRASWESIDLGCALARRHIKVIWTSWLFTVIPLWGVLALVLHNHPWWFIFCLWWLKPVYDRVVLFVVSRALFGAVSSFKDVLKAWPKILFKGVWSLLIVRRFSPSRSMTMPISELEGLKGRSYAKRVRLLEINGGEGASVATFAAMILEFVAFIGLLLLVFTMVPGEVSEGWGYAISEFLSNDDLTQFSPGLGWMIALTWMIAISLMEPFYVSAGFALYINSRTLTEGWDIELAFKRMGGRINHLKNGAKKTIMLLLVMLATAGLLMVAEPAMADVVTDVVAEDSAGNVENSSGSLQVASESSDTSILDVLKADEFKVHTKTEKVRVQKEQDRPDWNLGVLSGLGNLIFYTVLVAVIGGLIYLIYRNRHLLTGVGGIDRGQLPSTKVMEVMGMNVTPESLPQDIVAAARSAWNDGDQQLALSLLYRGAIAWFVNDEKLPIGESDTEGECLRHVESAGHDLQAPYFKSLTRAWVAMAYGRSQPDEVTMQGLFDRWPFYKGERRSK